MSDSTPITRLRALHAGLHRCGAYWFRPRPSERCDTIAALDELEVEYSLLAHDYRQLSLDNERLRKRNRPIEALQARIDAATVLIRQAMEERHYARHGGAAATIPGPASCHGCQPFRDWLAGDKEAVVSDCKKCGHKIEVHYCLRNGKLRCHLCTDWGKASHPSVQLTGDKEKNGG